MRDKNLYTGTWTAESGMATWSYTLPLAIDESPYEQVHSAAVRLLPLLQGFALPSEASWTTLADGEDAHTLRRQEIAPDAVSKVFADLRDTTDFDIALDLVVSTLADEQLIPGGGRVFVELWWPDAERPGAGVPTFRLVFNLDVDIYAKVGLRKEDNSVLAALNSPRLAGFLRRLREHLGAMPVRMSSDMGHHIGADGFLS